MKWTVFIFGLSFFVLSGCASPEVAPPLVTPDIEATIQARTKQTKSAQETIQAAIEQTQTAAPTATTVPTETPEPTAVEPESVENQPEVAILTAAAMFNEANVYSLGFPQDDVFLVTIEVPGGVEGDNYALVDGKQYECQVLEQYPDRLYCSGKAPQTNRFVIIQIIATDSEEVVFEAEIGVPAVASIPAAPSTGGGGNGSEAPQQPPAADPPKDDPPPPPDNPPPPPGPYPYP